MPNVRSCGIEVRLNFEEQDVFVGVRKAFPISQAMAFPQLPVGVYPVTTETRWRFRYLALTTLVTVILISWGSFVTSIDAGMAVPDWPQSFGTMDQFRTGYNEATGDDRPWWTNTDVLAEHGHRLWGAALGFLVIGLAFWVQLRDPRPAMRKLGWFMLVLVIAQGVLGGIRVTENSALLAGVHALTAQIFFAFLVSMTVATSRTWLSGSGMAPLRPALLQVVRWTLAGALVVYGQIVLGAFLRHGTFGVDSLIAAVHVGTAFIVSAVLITLYVKVEKHLGDVPLLRKAAMVVMVALFVQFALGLTAYAILLIEIPQALRSPWQVFAASAHKVVGAFLFTSVVTLYLLAARRSTLVVGDGLPADALPASRIAHPVA